jgi:hypothetical protein
MNSPTHAMSPQEPSMSISIRSDALSDREGLAQLVCDLENLTTRARGQLERLNSAEARLSRDALKASVEGEQEPVAAFSDRPSDVELDPSVALERTYDDPEAHAAALSLAVQLTDEAPAAPEDLLPLLRRIGWQIKATPHTDFGATIGRTTRFTAQSAETVWRRVAGRGYRLAAVGLALGISVERLADAMLLPDARALMQGIASLGSPAMSPNLDPQFAHLFVGR